MTKLDVLAGVVGVLVSLAISYIPGFQALLDKLDPIKKRLLQVVFALVAVMILLGLSCYGKSDVFECSENGVFNALELLFMYAVANQSTYVFTNRRDKTITITGKPVTIDDDELIRMP